jgi:hypothetical protein
VRLAATIERKQDDLPRFVVVPAADLAAWSLAGTTVVEVTLNDVAVERRTIKPWDADRWFLNITQGDCLLLGVDTGARLAIELRRANPEPPEEIGRLIATSPAAGAAWRALGEAGRRMLAEEVRRAKRPETRERRIRKALLGK